jgi:hypothetical protein
MGWEHRSKTKAQNTKNQNDAGNKRDRIVKQ